MHSRDLKSSGKTLLFLVPFQSQILDTYLPTFESTVGGDDHPLKIAEGVIARDDLFPIHLYYFLQFWTKSTKFIKW